jgi:hypothetical protein
LYKPGCAALERFTTIQIKTNKKGNEYIGSAKGKPLNTGPSLHKNPAFKQVEGRTLFELPFGFRPARFCPIYFPVAPQVRSKLLENIVPV